MNVFKKFWKLMKGSRLLYLGSIITTIIASLFMFTGPYVIKLTIDSIIGNKVIQAPLIVMKMIDVLGGRSNLSKNLWICGLFLILLSVLEGTFMYFKGKWSAQASEAMAQRLRNSLYEHLTHLPHKYFVDAKTGDLVQRCSSDVETIRSFFAVQLVEVGRTIFIVLISLILMLQLNVNLTIAAMLFVPVIILFSMMYFQKIRKQFKVCDEAEGEVSTAIQENLSGVRVVKAFAKEKFEINKFDKKNKNYISGIYDLIKMFSTYWAISDLLNVMQVILLTITTTYYTVNGKITLGTMVLFLQYEGIFLWPIRQFGRLLTEMGKSTVSIERVEEILNEKIEEFDKNAPKIRLKGEIEFNNVTFAYDNGQDVLKNLSFKINEGETVAILGATGTGKSSLLHLIPRLYDYTKGSIKIGGIELNTIDRKRIRENIGIVLQEPFLFSKTIYNNMSLARKEAKNQDIFEAARVASIHDVINEFDKGYDTAIGEKGVTLSGGQKQRLAIARTLLKEAPILIFDDSLSALDTETDKKIRLALNEKNKDTTTLIISHRISTLSEADRILVLEDGKIIQEGTHEKLISVDGIYKRIWNIQNKLETEIENEFEDVQKSKLQPRNI